MNGSRVKIETDEGQRYFWLAEVKQELQGCENILAQLVGEAPEGYEDDEYRRRALQVSSVNEGDVRAIMDALAALRQDLRSDMRELEPDALEGEP